MSWSGSFSPPDPPFLQNVLPPPEQDSENKIVIRQTTFSISEEFLRRTFFLKKKINARFIVVIDRKALQKIVSIWRFVAQVYDEVWLSDSHAKILLVDDASRGRHVSLVTSQNLTRGNRAESAVVSSLPDVYDSLLADFEDLRKNHSVPMHEIMPLVNEQQQPSESRLDAIERLAGCFVPISDIAVVLDEPASQLRDAIADIESPESLAYNRGKTKAKVRLRAQEMELACIGSPLGMQSVRENLVSMESDEL